MRILLICAARWEPVHHVRPIPYRLGQLAACVSFTTAMYAHNLPDTLAEFGQFGRYHGPWSVDLHCHLDSDVRVCFHTINRTVCLFPVWFQCTTRGETMYSLYLLLRSDWQSTNTCPIWSIPMVFFSGKSSHLLHMQLSVVITKMYHYW